MLAKGIIDSIDFSSNTCIVRIPQFETANSDPIILSATFSITPGMYNGYKENDVVWVAFENNRLEHPVIIGKLFLGTEKENKDPRGTINCMISTTSQKANIPQDTVLTNEVGDDIPNTQVPYNNINELANKLNDVDVNLEYSVRDIDNRIKMKVNSVDGDESTGWGWELSPSGWSITSNGEEFFTVNKDGMTVKNKGKIGQFSVGAAHICDITGKEESGIYSDNYIERFEDNPDGKTGVYIGTDGIKLGNDFYIKTDGEIGATKFSSTFSNLLKTSVNIQDGNSNIEGVYCKYEYNNKWTWFVTTSKEGLLKSLAADYFWNEKTQAYSASATLFEKSGTSKSYIALPDFKEYLDTNYNLSDYIVSFKYKINNPNVLTSLSLQLGYLNNGSFSKVYTIVDLLSLGEALDYTLVHYQLQNYYNRDNLRLALVWSYHNSVSRPEDQDYLELANIKEIKIEKNTMDVVNKTYTFSYSQYDLTNSKVGGIKGEVSYTGYTNAQMEDWRTKAGTGEEINFPNSSVAWENYDINQGDLFNVVSITTDTENPRVYTFICKMTNLDEHSNIIGQIESVVVSAESVSQTYLYTSTKTNAAPSYPSTDPDIVWQEGILEPTASTPFVWRITGYQKADTTTYLASTIALIASGTGIISILSAGTIDGKTVDLIELDTSTTPNKYVMHADKLTGTVNSNVHIGHNTYGFDIISGDNSHPSAIYSGIASFNDSQHNEGVYLGTDGINIGQKFKVDNQGNITATGLEASKIHIKDSNDNNKTILLADTTSPEDTQVGGFKISTTSLTSDTVELSTNLIKLKDDQGETAMELSIGNDNIARLALGGPNQVKARLVDPTQQNGFVFTKTGHYPKISVLSDLIPSVDPAPYIKANSSDGYTFYNFKVASGYDVTRNYPKYYWEDVLHGTIVYSNEHWTQVTTSTKLYDVQTETEFSGVITYASANYLYRGNIGDFGNPFENGYFNTINFKSTNLIRSAISERHETYWSDTTPLSTDNTRIYCFRFKNLQGGAYEDVWRRFTLSNVKTICSVTASYNYDWLGSANPSGSDGLGGTNDDYAPIVKWYLNDRHLAVFHVAFDNPNRTDISIIVVAEHTSLSNYD